MKHCRNCNYCSKDMVAEYVKGLDLYKCRLDSHVIQQPFFEKCERYEKDNFGVGGIRKWLGDWVCHN